MGGVPLPATLPAFNSLMTDALDHVETPVGLRIYEIGADYLLGHATDEFGIERVELWPFNRTAPGGQAGDDPVSR